MEEISKFMQFLRKLRRDHNVKYQMSLEKYQGKSDKALIQTVKSGTSFAQKRAAAQILQSRGYGRDQKG